MVEQELNEIELKEFANSCSSTSIAMSLLYETPVSFYIGDLRSLKPKDDSKQVFFHKSHPISAAEIFGVVTSVKQKEDHVIVEVADGTGNIQCFCPHREDTFQPVDRIVLSNTSKAIKERISKVSITHTVKVGDFLRVRGSVKHGLWENVIYLSKCTLGFVKNYDIQRTWKTLTDEKSVLYEIYNQ